MNPRLRFGPFDVDTRAGELRRDGRVVPLQDLPFRLLAALLERPGDVVTRAELTSRLWGTETFVDATAGLNTAVAKVREALGDEAERPIYVETVPKRGYRFIGTIRTDEADLGQPVDLAREGAAPDGSRAAGLAPAAAADDSARLASKRRPLALTVALVVVAFVVIAVIAGVTAYQLHVSRPQTRVAVVLFDNETGRPEVGRLSQNLTDATVFALTADPRLAVIGNAAVLRTERPFRDIALVRDALRADFIVIGQVQTVDDRLLVRSHLIRAADQAHVWVHAERMTAGEEVLQSEVSRQIAAAVSSRAAR